MASPSRRGRRLLADQETWKNERQRRDARRALALHQQPHEFMRRVHRHTRRERGTQSGVARYDWERSRNQEDISKHAERTAVMGSQITGTVLTKKLQSVSQITAQSRGTKSLPVKPEDRREPSIGLRFKVLQRDQFRCRLCGRSPATELSCKLHVDHVLAFSKGGKTILENLQTLCSTCNVGKSNRSIEQQT